MKNSLAFTRPDFHDDLIPKLLKETLKIKDETKLRLYVPSTNINVIYLIDVTSSMKKHENIIKSIKGVNQKLKDIHQYIEFGFILYRDYPINISKYELELKPEYIEVINLSPYRFFSSEVMFYGGDDYAEDWANAYYAASQLNLNENIHNIIIHFCDAGAHSKYFSDYDNRNEQESL